MDKETAMRLLDVIYAINGELDKMTELTDDIIDKKEMHEARKNIANASIILNIDILVPIVKQYPDLDPDKEVLEKIREDQRK